MRTDGIFKYAKVKIWAAGYIITKHNRSISMLAYFKHPFMTPERGKSSTLLAWILRHLKVKQDLFRDQNQDYFFIVCLYPFCFLSFFPIWSSSTQIISQRFQHAINGELSSETSVPHLVNILLRCVIVKLYTEETTITSMIRRIRMHKP